MNLRPSSLPAIAACPQYQADERDNDDTNEGTRRHAVLHHYNLTGEFEIPEGGLSDESQEAVKWASEYIDMTRSGDPIFESKIAIALNVDGQAVTIEGTPDCRDTDTRNLYDLKWRHRDYRAQLNAYALGIMQDNFTDAIKVHVMFGYDKRAQTWDVTADEAEEELQGIVRRALNNEPANPCDYCAWCAKSATCPALAERVEAVRSGREDWNLANYHASQIDDPAEMAKALELARAIKAWVEAIEYHARRMALQNGGLPGFKVQNRSGKKSITDIAQAVALSGLSPDDFIRICNVSLGDLKKLHHEKLGASYTSKAASDRDCLRKLEPITETGEPVVMLVKNRKEK